MLIAGLSGLDRCAQAYGALADPLRESTRALDHEQRAGEGLTARPQAHVASTHQQAPATLGAGAAGAAAGAGQAQAVQAARCKAGDASAGGSGGGQGGGGGGNNSGSGSGNADAPKPPSPPSEAAATTDGPGVQGGGIRSLAAGGARGSSA